MLATESFRDLGQMLSYRSATMPARRAFGFISGGAGTTCATIDRAELDLRARQIASALHESGAMEGARVLLVTPAGIDFVSSLFGCFYAGAIPVPLFPPREGRLSRRFQHVVRDSGARHIILCKSQDGEIVRSSLDREMCFVHPEDALPVTETMRASPPAIAPDAPALLQYTSGSTAEPKGVVLTHRSILSNLAQIADAFTCGQEDVVVSWLPPFHDMGLIGTILVPIYVGFPSYLMAPFVFVQRPARWLQAVSRLKGSIMGGPNFALDFCVDRIAESELAGIDLSSLKVIFSGGEPIRAETLRRFGARFSRYGLESRAILPCYGLAEATLFVTGGEQGHGWSSAKDGSNARERVSCGRTRGDTEIRIIDPITYEPVADGHEGEIWVRGSSVARGYWQRPEATRDTFQAILPGESEGTWLRTGDLGAVVAGELYPSGRLKNVLIHDGRKIAAEDLEALVLSALNAPSEPGGAVAMAFTTRADAGPEAIALAIELAKPIAEPSSGDTPQPWEDLGARIRAVVARELDGVPVRKLFFLDRGRLLRTSSGKLERAASGRAIEEGRIPILARWLAQEGRTFS